MTAANQRRLRITLRQLEVFVAVARERSTRAAGASVARSQSAASSALAELELTMGYPLFDRVGKKLILNESGRRFLPSALSLLDQGVELENVFNGKAAATPLLIASSMTIGENILPSLIAQWRLTHPRNPVRMLVMNTVEVLHAIAELEADIGFIEGPQTKRGLTLSPWFSDEMVIVAAPHHPLASGVASKAALREASWAMREVGSGSREAAERWLLEQLGSVQIEFELGMPQAVAALVSTGAALACLPRHSVARGVALGELSIVRHMLPPSQRQLTMVTHAGRRLGPCSDAFVLHCRAQVQAQGLARLPAGLAV
ncbi:LysR substrate-binding domain-containing protein [Pseudorhodoferax soli]|uniref:DNA-binding transcriptional LysR family regulator n=1 Tax=Pseudorhodoferax soli TaxID=545864 RepID=A0A368XL99_9BURK|nr:LysR substrate-binding domain-containing protein [Pseudorhodoferax soli]RCW68690.1 DNA-binding transcriptional LysR family regulator [Pseudorhodoferax soli]